jgi:hypothetical protein
VGRRFNQYQHPFQLEMKKVMELTVAVMIVVDKGRALAIYSLPEPCVRLTTPRARHFATALVSMKVLRICCADSRTRDASP